MPEKIKQASWLRGWLSAKDWLAGLLGLILAGLFYYLLFSPLALLMRLVSPSARGFSRIRAKAGDPSASVRTTLEPVGRTFSKKDFETQF